MATALIIMVVLILFIGAADLIWEAVSKILNLPRCSACGMWLRNGQDRHKDHYR